MSLIPREHEQCSTKRSRLSAMEEAFTAHGIEGDAPVLESIASFLDPRARAALELASTFELKAVASPSGWALEITDRTTHGVALPRGNACQEMMAELFRKDVSAREHRNAEDVPVHEALLDQLREPSLQDGVAVETAAPPITLRILTWNIHFWREGFSHRELGDNRAGVEAVLRAVNPDVVLLQEVVLPDELRRGDATAEGIPACAATPRGTSADAAALLRMLDPSLGFRYAAAAPDADGHVMEENIASCAGMRTAVVMLSKLPIENGGGEAVPMGGDSNGHSVYGVISLPLRGSPGKSPGSEYSRRRLGVHSVHLSVGCAPSLRQRELAGVVRHAERAVLHGDVEGVLITGDFNQPTARDYDDETWSALALDMRGAGLPLSDGVAQMLRDGDGISSKWISAFDEVTSNPPSSTAWSGASVDFAYRLKECDVAVEGGIVEAAAVATVATVQADAWRVVGAWPWYSTASDHLPLVVDLALRR